MRENVGRGPRLFTIPIGRNKQLELQRIKFGKKGRRSIGFNVSVSFRQDHAGLYASLSIWSIQLVLHIYDGRHWCSEHRCWLDEDHQHDD